MDGKKSILLLTAMFVAGLFLIDRPVCINVVCKEIHIVEAEPFESTDPVYEEKVISSISYTGLYPKDIPFQKIKWTFTGGDDIVHLKEHLILTHKIQPWLLTNFTKQSELINLHSYLHNGGKL